MATKVKLIETGAVTGNIIPDGGIATGKLANDAVTTIKISDANITHAKLHTSMDLTGKTVTVATAAGSTNTTAAASTAFVQQELTTLIGGAPSTLNDLNELAAAINDDANYNSTLTTALATKLPLAGGTMTGALVMGASALTLNGSLGTWSVNAEGARMSFGRNSANYINATHESGYLVFQTSNGETALTLNSSQEATFTNKLSATEVNIGAVQAQGSKLRVNGKIVAGDVGSTGGDVLLEGYYGNGATAVIGSERSSGGVFLGYGVHPSTTTQGQFLSSTTATLSQGAYVVSDTHKWYTVTAGSSVAVGSQLTTMTERMRITGAGNVGIGTDTPAAGLQVGKGLTNAGGPAAGASTASACFGNDGSDDNYGLVLGADGNGVGYISAQRTDGVATAYNLSIQPNGGNVGIGETVPLGKLHVKLQDTGATANAVGNLLVLEGTENGISLLSSTSGAGYILFGDSDDNAHGGILYDHSAGAMRFRTGSTWDQMKILANGNVLVGQSTAGTNGKLQVTGGIGLTGASVIRLQSNADDSNSLKFWGNQFVAGQNNSHSYSYSGGGLIASVSPSAGAILLDVGANSTSGHRLKVINGSNGADGSLQYLSGTTSRFHVDSSSGKVGIGTASPTNKLGINRTSINSNERLINLYTGTTTANAYVSIGAQYAETNALSNSEIRFGNEVQSNAPSFLAFATGNTSSPAERMRIDSSGNVGIGENNPAHLLDILKSGSGDAAIQIKSTTGGDPTLIFNSAAANRQGIIKFQDNGTNVGRIGYVHNGDRMDFQAGSASGATMSIKNGKVGIGTISPETTIDLQGALLMRANTANIGLGTFTSGSGMTPVSGGELQFMHMWSGVMAANDTIVFTYAATSWKSFWFEITASSTSGYGHSHIGGYSNNSLGVSQLETISTSMWTLAASNNGQALTFTVTLNANWVHPLIKINFGCGGGEGAPKLDRCSLVITS